MTLFVSCLLHRDPLGLTQRGNVLVGWAHPMAIPYPTAVAGTLQTAPAMDVAQPVGRSGLLPGRTKAKNSLVGKRDRALSRQGGKCHSDGA